jgi:tetratricopeptide (TPR) repeat protein
MTNEKRTFRTAAALAALMTLGGCATGPGGQGIYAPMGGSERTRAPEPPTAGQSDAGSEPRVWRKSEQTEEQAPDQSREERRSPSYSEAGEQLPAAARSLVDEGSRRLAGGDVAGAIASLERAQRIAPRSAEVYFKLSEAYVRNNNLGAAEQFTLKGLSLAGNNDAMQRAGWQLLADIRRARGNVAGADQAEARARAL